MSMSMSMSMPSLYFARGITIHHRTMVMKHSSYHHLSSLVSHPVMLMLIFHALTPLSALLSPTTSSSEILRPIHLPLLPLILI
jgi:hypothetical protein